MKGILLAGGTGSRLKPLTSVTNKHLLPVYDKPMIMHPLENLVQNNIRDVMIVSGSGHAGHFLELFGYGTKYGVRMSYTVQEEPGGIAQALGLAEDFADDDSVAVMLGDNIFQQAPDFKNFSHGARIFLKEVDNPKRFGVAELDNGRIVGIEEKPTTPKSAYAVTGAYIYDNTVFDIIRTLTPSGRQELEITDVNNHYIATQTMDYRMVEGFWTDAGTIESLYRANTLVKNNK